MNLTLRTQIAVGYLVALVLMLILGIIPYRSLGSVQDTSRWVTHTYQVLHEAEATLGLFKDAEINQRGYVITGDERFLEPYREALARVPTAFGELRSLTRDNPAQQQRLSALQPVVEARLAHAAAVVQLRKTQGLEAAAAVVSEGKGRDLSEQVRRMMGEFSEVESTLLAQRIAESQQNAAQARATILYGTLGIIAVMFVVGFWIARSLTARLAAAVQQVQSAAAELQSAASEQATASTEQKAAVSEASTTLKELVATSRQMADGAKRVTGIAEETATAARTGDTTVLRAQDAINGIKRQVDQIVGHMLELGKKSQQVGSVLDLINELAEQTNILAINATIESAGAGESGRRFAVVAEEIRKLADRVGGSTKEIRSLIDDIRSSANTTVMATEDGVKSVDAGTRQFGEVTGSIRQIADRVLTTSDAAREIELGTRQQVTAVEQVSTALAGIAQASTQNETTTRQTADTAALLVQLSKGLQTLVGTAR